MEIKIADYASDTFALARLFAANLSPDYISHEELQSHRALAPGKWAPDIEQVLRREVAQRLGPPMGQFPSGRNWRGAVEAYTDQALVGLAFVSITADVPTPFGMIGDIVIDTPHRGGRLGEELIRWILDRFVAAGIRRTFLESGAGNEAAHRLFSRLGYKTLSVVMMRDEDGHCSASG
jgi:ribosomal protein S18 acetylase RimI-like enzyme